MAKKGKLYKARWARAGMPAIGSVDLNATSDESAKKQFDRIARELGLPNTPRTIMCEGKVIETLDRGAR